jgi:hypothetical protein
MKSWIIAPILFLYQSQYVVRCRPSFLAVSSLPETDPKFFYTFWFRFSLGSRNADDKGDAVDSTYHTRPDWPHLDRVSYENGNIVNFDMYNNHIVAWALIPYLNLIMIPADSEKWWKDLSPTLIFVVLSIVLGSVGTLWPTSLRSFAALPTALNYKPFLKCSRVSRCNISSMVSGTGLLSFKFSLYLWTRCSWTSAFSPLSFLWSVVSSFDSSLSASCTSFEWIIRPVEDTSLNLSCR